MKIYLEINLGIPSKYLTRTTNHKEISNVTAQITHNLQRLYNIKYSGVNEVAIL